MLNKSILLTGNTLPAIKWHYVYVWRLQNARFYSALYRTNDPEDEANIEKVNQGLVSSYVPTHLEFIAEANATIISVDPGTDSYSKFPRMNTGPDEPRYFFFLTQNTASSNDAEFQGSWNMHGASFYLTSLSAGSTYGYDLMYVSRDLVPSIGGGG